MGSLHYSQVFSNNKNDDNKYKVKKNIKRKKETIIYKQLILYRCVSMNKKSKVSEVDHPFNLCDAPFIYIKSEDCFKKQVENNNNNNSKNQNDPAVFSLAYYPQ